MERKQEINKILIPTLAPKYRRAGSWTRIDWELDFDNPCESQLRIFCDSLIIV